MRPGVNRLGDLRDDEMTDVTLSVEDWRCLIYTTDPRNCGPKFERLWEIATEGLTKAEAEIEVTIRMPRAFAPLCWAGNPPAKRR